MRGQAFPPRDGRWQPAAGARRSDPAAAGRSGQAGAKSTAGWVGCRMGAARPERRRKVRQGLDPRPYESTGISRIPYNPTGVGDDMQVMRCHIRQTRLGPRAQRRAAQYDRRGAPGPMPTRPKSPRIKSHGVYSNRWTVPRKTRAWFMHTPQPDHDAAKKRGGPRSEWTTISTAGHHPHVRGLGWSG